MTDQNDETPDAPGAPGAASEPDDEFDDGADDEPENGADDEPENGADDEPENGADDEPENGADDEPENGADREPGESFEAGENPAENDDHAGTWDDGLLVTPPTSTRRRKRKEWRQSERARRYAARRSVRFPIFTRSVLLWVLLFAMMGIATGGTSAFFWAHFNTQISELREQTRDFDKRSQDAQAQIDAMRNQAITEINSQIKPILPYIADTKTIQLAQVFSPYVWFVATLDENGNPAVGTAFAVVGDEKSTLFVTSLNTVKATSVSPGPEIELRKTFGTVSDSFKAKIVNYDANRDLALIEAPRGGIPVLDWATDEQQAGAPGLLVFAATGFGGAGASLYSGRISTQDASGFTHNITLATYAQGAPIVTADAKILGVGSLTYHPFGFDSGEIHFSISINQVCLELMECGGGARRAKENKTPPPLPKK